MVVECSNVLHHLAISRCISQHKYNQMSRDSIFFCILIIIISALSGMFIPVILSFVVIMLVIIAFTGVVHFVLVRQKAEGKANPLEAYGALQLDFNVLPSHLSNTEEAIVHLLNPKDRRNANRQFLVMVKAIGLHDAVPPNMEAGIAKKIIYEFHRKYGTTDYPFDTAPDALKLAEVCRPFQPEEAIDFQRFCTTLQ
jgi:hypothetical protein